MAGWLHLRGRLLWGYGVRRDGPHKEKGYAYISCLQRINVEKAFENKVTT